MAFIQGESPAAITREAVEALGGMGRFVAKGDVVMIKPNIGWDRTPELAACTNPEVVKTLVEMCLEAGAKKVIVMDNTTNQAQRCYARSGIAAAAKAAGADVPFVNERRIKKMAIKGEWLKDWDVIQDFVEVDKLINVPIAKHHSLCRVTLGMKNWLGAIGDPRNQLHQKLDQAEVDLAAFFKPTLTVLDAYRILVRNGPQGGRPSRHEAHEDGRGRAWITSPSTPWAPRSSTSRRPSSSSSSWPPSAGWAGSTWRSCALKKERSKKYRRLQLVRVGVQAVFFALFLCPPVRDAFHRQGLHRRRRGLLPLRSAARRGGGHRRAGRLRRVHLGRDDLLVDGRSSGRVVCGWVCPLGAVHQFFSWLFKKDEAPPAAEDRHRRAVPGNTSSSSSSSSARVFTLDLVGIFDPLSFLYRTIDDEPPAGLRPGTRRCSSDSLYSLGLEGHRRQADPGRRER